MILFCLAMSNPPPLPPIESPIQPPPLPAWAQLPALETPILPPPLPWWYRNQCELLRNCQEAKRAKDRAQAAAAEEKKSLMGDHPSNPINISDFDDDVVLEGKYPFIPIVISDDDQEVEEEKIVFELS